MSDAPVSSSAHARKVQILVWSGTASITVVQTLLALIAYLKLEGGSTVVPGLDRWQVMYAGHVLISLTCLLLLIPVLRGPRPSLSILLVVLGFIPPGRRWRLMWLRLLSACVKGRKRYRPWWLPWS